MNFASQNLTAGQLNAIVKKLGGEEGARRFLRGELLVKAVELVSDVFRVTVDYSQSLADMIKAGNYDWVNDDVTEEHFPGQGSGKQELELRFIHFNRAISSDEVKKELDERGFRPATFPELLALGAIHPDFQRQFSIVALGSVWQRPGGDRLVPSLWSSSFGRRLSLYWLEDGWRARYRFLAVSK